MKRLFKVLFVLLMVLLTALAIAVAAGVWHARSKLPQRSGTLSLHGLQAPVQVNWDERGVPHIQAQNEADLYRALGFLHAQDRLFQMEMVRRLARGELAEILGAKLVDTDRLFRTLELRAQAEQSIQRMDRNSPAWLALLAYLDGINEFQDTRPLPVEFDVLGIQPQHYTPVDTMAVAGYLAYSFAAALRTEPALTYVRDQLGPDYLRAFELEWQPLGVLGPMAQRPVKQGAPRLSQADWQSLARVAEVSQQALELAGVPLFEGSNAWAIAGTRTASGKPLLAGDPHIAFSLPAVWYEAHLNAPGFELYGHFQALNPFALLGHNQQFGWSLTMFQNDDMDLVALRTNPARPSQVAYQGQWVELRTRTELIQVKGAEPVSVTLQRSPFGPVINQAFPDSLGQAPVALWWTFLETENPVMEAFHELNRADTLAKARSAASKIHAPGLNIVWANAAGDIAWWAAARLVQRPFNVNPSFILDGGTAQADKPGYYRFADNPQEENPARGYIMSANHQPVPRSGVPVPGYYNLYDRARRLDQLLRARGVGSTGGEGNDVNRFRPAEQGERRRDGMRRFKATVPGDRRSPRPIERQLASRDQHRPAGGLDRAFQQRADRNAFVVVLFVAAGEDHQIVCQRRVHDDGVVVSVNGLEGEIGSFFPVRSRQQLQFIEQSAHLGLTPLGERVALRDQAVPSSQQRMMRHGQGCEVGERQEGCEMSAEEIRELGADRQCVAVLPLVVERQKNAVHCCYLSILDESVRAAPPAARTGDDLRRDAFR